MASTGEVWRLGRRPALDGLRGIAVLAVMAQHMGVGVPVAGIGVPLFFALSGYLITGLLLHEHADSGTVNVRAFYWRRAARLVPALLLAVLVADTAFVALGEPGLAIASLSALLYVSNYVTIATGQYLPAWGQTWSLGVEEHFYLAWPLIFLWLARRCQPRRLLAVTLGLCGLDLVWRAVLLGMHGSTMHFAVGSLEHADALLYGCAAAVAVRIGWRPRRWMLPASVALAAGYLMAHQPLQQLASTAVLGIASSLVVVSVDCGVVSAARKTCSWAPLVGVGRRSYGLYLWHQPMTVLVLLIGLSGGRGLLISVAVTFAAAWASYRWVETPVLLWSRRPRVDQTVPAVALAAG